MKPFLHSMEIRSGLTGASNLILGVTEDQKCLVGIIAKAVILEAGFDITSETLMDDGPRDLLGEYTQVIEDLLIEELKHRFGIDEIISLEKVQRLKEALEGRKLAIVYVLDGSSFGLTRVPNFDETYGKND